MIDKWNIIYERMNLVMWVDNYQQGIACLEGGTILFISCGLGKGCHDKV